jgi:AcrR family transcriptional regulator
VALAKFDDAELARRAAETFRIFGYEGTSLNRLAKATGLEKASLYYRFPGGKDAILMAAVNGVGSWLQANIFEPLARPGALADRIEVVVERLRAFYGNGTKPCVLDTLSLKGGTPELETALRGAVDGWLNAFAEVAREAGYSPEEAQRRAEQAIIAIEGSLVLARVTGYRDVFERGLGELRSLLIGE